MDALDNFALFEFLFGDPADAVGGEVCVSGLNAPKAAQVLVALLLPLGDQVGVSVLLFDAKVVQLSEMSDLKW